ncbi:MAG TPA: NAD-dependent epimerase/dehydratase family protein [Acidimicrobiales bacterium]|nr:NAD-dependent epimerase/dehydratase family protein [Acidimicrobiales bacterium]
MGRRVLVTGLGSFWGGRVAQALEADPGVDVIIGLDTREPNVELDRTEYVRADESYSILSRIVRATQVDTIVHTFLVIDSSQASPRQMHESNVIGTMNLFAAASQAESRVRTVVVKSSTLVYGSTHADPVWFTEETRRPAFPKGRVERSLLEVEGYVRDYAADSPHVTVSLLRFSNVLGADIVTPITKALQLPLVPCVFGYDPRVQFVHEQDVVRAIMFVLDNDLGGIYNVAGDGLLPWSEVAAICAKRLWPLPPVGRGLVGQVSRRFGIDLPPEMLDLLTYGRGADNRRLKAAGFEYRYSSAGAVHAFAEAARLRHTVGPPTAYRYERDVEQFFRHSPAVVRDGRG